MILGHMTQILSFDATCADLPVTIIIYKNLINKIHKTISTIVGAIADTSKKSAETSA